MQKIRKILRAVSEKTALPTNQPTNYYQQHQSYRTSLIDDGPKMFKFIAWSLKNIKFHLPMKNPKT